MSNAIFAIAWGKTSFITFLLAELTGVYFYIQSVVASRRNDTANSERMRKQGLTIIYGTLAISVVGLFLLAYYSVPNAR